MSHALDNAIDSIIDVSPKTRCQRISTDCNYRYPFSQSTGFRAILITAKLLPLQFCSAMFHVLNSFSRLCFLFVISLNSAQLLHTSYILYQIYSAHFGMFKIYYGSCRKNMVRFNTSFFESHRKCTI